MKKDTGAWLWWPFGITAVATLIGGFITVRDLQKQKERKDGASR